VDDAFLYGFIDQRDGFSEERLGLGSVARLKSGTEATQSGAKAGPMGAILGRTFCRLARALERRNMICHVLFVILWDFSEGLKTAEWVILKPAAG
jgi:hypothetical protein